MKNADGFMHGHPMVWQVWQWCDRGHCPVLLCLWMFMKWSHTYTFFTQIKTFSIQGQFTSYLHLIASLHWTLYAIALLLQIYLAISLNTPLHNTLLHHHKNIKWENIIWENSIWVQKFGESMNLSYPRSWWPKHLTMGVYFFHLLHERQTDTCINYSV